MFPNRMRDGTRGTLDKRVNVATGWPYLWAAMQAAQINTPRRIAAFFATLLHESYVEPDIHQFGTTAMYTGRGYIQLTGVLNYTAAGEYLGLHLAHEPNLALVPANSAKIATWYWTVNRHCNLMADGLYMGRINAAIGYPRSSDGSNDEARCKTFAQALQYLTGSVPAGINCDRKAVMP
jgi:putative chitinase